MTRARSIAFFYILIQWIQLYVSCQKFNDKNWVHTKSHKTCSRKLRICQHKKSINPKVSQKQCEEYYVYEIGVTFSIMLNTIAFYIELKAM